MKDAHAILRQKESDLTRVRREIESLRIAACLLEETDNFPNLQLTGIDDDRFPSDETKRSSLWKVLKRAK